MDDLFGPGGALARALPEYEPRPEQAALAVAVERALATGEHLVAEAGTGVGKSLAYLIPALESGQRVVVATATKALQEQLLHKDVPTAAAAVGRELDVVVLKGRQNYLCRRQLQGFQPFLLPDGRDGQAWEAMQGWLDETETGDRAELEVEPSEALWAELAVGADRCSGRRCPFVSSCFAEAARERAAQRLETNWLKSWLTERTSVTPEHLDHIPAGKPDEPGILIEIMAGPPGCQPEPFRILIDGTHRGARKLRDRQDYWTFLLTEEEQRSICTYRLEGRVAGLPLLAGPGISAWEAGVFMSFARESDVA